MGAVTSLEIQKGDKRAVVTKEAVQPAEKPEVKSEVEPKVEKDEKAGAGTVPVAVQFEWRDSHGKTIASDKVERLLNPLSRLKCEGYINDRAKDDLKSPRWTITIKDAGAIYSLSVFAKQAEDDTSSPAITSTSPYVFNLSDSTVNSIEEQMKSFFPDEEKSEPQKE